MWQPRLADPTPWGWALLLAQAAVLAAVVVAGARRGWRAWVWPFLLLALLVVDRLVDLGLLTYISGRRALRALDVYGDRRPWQIGGSIALASVVVVLAITAIQAGRGRFGRLGSAWWAVVASGLALVAIQSIRIISLHEIDSWMGMPLPFPGGLRLFQALPMAPIVVALAGAVAASLVKAPAHDFEAPRKPRRNARIAGDSAPGPHWAIRLVLLLLLLTVPEWAGLMARRVSLGPSPSAMSEGGGR